MKKKKVIILAVGLAVTTALIFGFTKINNFTKVKFVKPQYEYVKKTVSATGSIKSRSEADLAFPATGRITKISLSEKENVTKNKSLAELYPLVQQESANAYKDARDVALRNKDAYIQEYEGDEFIEFRQGEEYSIQLRKYDELISQSEANYKTQLAGLKNYYIIAPSDGTVIDIYKDVGEIAAAGSTIIKIADLNELYFEAEIEQEDFGQLISGQRVDITLSSYEDIIFTGWIVELPRYAQTDATGDTSFIAEISLDESQPANILLGMEGDIEIIIEQTPNTTQAVDFDTIQYNDDGTKYIWIEQNGKAKKMTVETGLEGDFLTEVKTDLKNVNIITPTDSKTELKENLKLKIVD